MRPRVEATKKAELKVWLLQTLRYGQEEARTGKQLASWLEGSKDDRRIRLVIRDLIKDGYPIASSTSPPLGFFMTGRPEEARKYIQDLRNRILEDARRLRDYKIAARGILNPGQLSLM